MELTVSAYVKQIQADLANVGQAVVEGEVQEFREFGRGVLSFMLIDAKSKVPCKFLPWSKHLTHKPQNGDLVKVRINNLTYWDAGGRVEADIQDVELAGEGFLLKQRQDLINKFEAEGLTSPISWGELPVFPQNIGIISAEASDALADVIVGLQTRMPSTNILVCHSTVQGKMAVEGITKALDTLNQTDVEIIIIARGGGAAHDLIAFDDESLCRSIHASLKPVIVAIGHTKDNPVCNFITHKADLPRAASVLAVRDSTDLLAEFKMKQDLLDQKLKECDNIIDDCHNMYRQLTIDYHLQTFSNQLLSDKNTLQESAHLLMTETLKVLDDAALSHVVQSQNILNHSTAREKHLQLFQSLYERKLLKIEHKQQGLIEKIDLLNQHKTRILESLNHDYNRALSRTSNERKRAAKNYLERYKASANNFTHLLNAHDFRKQGWIVATNIEGKPIKHLSNITIGEDILLHFEDGKATANIKKKET